jgi:hypothetical protein
MNDLQIDVDAEAIFLDGAWYTREALARRIRAMLDSGDFNVARPSAALEALTQTVKSLRTLSFRCTPDIEQALNEIASRTGSTVGGVVREAVIQFLQETGRVPPSTGSGSKQAVVRPTAQGAPASAVPAVPAPFPSTPPAPAVPPPTAAPASSASSFSSLPLVVDVDEAGTDDEERRQEERTVRRPFPVPPTGTTQDDLPKVIIEEQPLVIAGPGALANAGLLPKPIELTQKKSPDKKPDEAVPSEQRWFKP